MTKTIVDIQVVDAEKRRFPSKHYVYTIVVKWSGNSSMVVYRRYSRFFDLQTQLLDKFPIEAGTTDPSLRIIPFLPGKIFFGRSQIRDVAMKRLGEIDAYCKNLLNLPDHISQCDEVLEFFEVEADDLDPPKEDPTKNKAEKKAEKISGPKRLEQFMAVADYRAQEKGEMDLQAGMTVEVAEKSESGWWFVNAEDQQGWVPSTYLQPVNGSASGQGSTATSVSGEDEKYICIEIFTATNSDELSLGKGVVVEVQQKNMDGWWIVKYQGQEGFAPATYLKKCTDPYAMSLVEKSRQSGVQIIGNLSDVSTLITSSSSPRNSGIFAAGNARDSTITSTAQSDHSSMAQTQGRANEEETEESGDEWDEGEEKDIVDTTGPRGKSFASVMKKHHSLERGGSLKPPPRQNSVKQMVVSPTPPSPSKSSSYVTISDFEDTVGDGISFTAGETVTVLEKTTSGWWFVQRGNDEGWVPESFLEQANTQMSSVAGSSTREEDDSENDESEDEERQQPSSAVLTNALNSRLKSLNQTSKPSAPTSQRPPKLPQKATSNPPALPNKPRGQLQSEDSQEEAKTKTSAALHDQPASGLASALKSKFDQKPPGLKTHEKPAPPSLPSKPPGKPGLPNKPPVKPSLPCKPVEKPKPPGLPEKPSEKPGLPSLPKKPEKTEGSSGATSVAGLASSLKSKFEAQHQDDRSSKPSIKPVFNSSKPSVPSKVFGDSHSKPNLPHKSDGEVRPSTAQKPFLPSNNCIASGNSVKPSFPAAKTQFNPPKLPSKPQIGSKPCSDTNNNRGADRPASSKVQGMAAVFSKPDAGPKPILPVKKPALPQPPAQKPNYRDSEDAASKPRVGSLVSELGSKLQFGGAESSIHKGQESSSINKLGSHSVQLGDGHKVSDHSSSGRAAPWSAGQKTNNSIPASTLPGLQYEVIADFDGESQSELSVQCGDIVEVMSQDQQDWWLVRLNNEEGWVPTSYLEPAAEWDD